jgi:acetyl esterase/lipase
VFGDAHTHDRLVRELAVGVEAAAVFPEYSRSPEARYPIAIEQSYTVAGWVETDGAGKGLDTSRIAVAGDSVGGNMSAALTLMAKERGGPTLAAQVLFYPVTNASFDTSYEQFAEGYFLRRDGMEWFWDPVHDGRGAAQRDHGLAAACQSRAALGATAGARDHRRGRRPP